MKRILLLPIIAILIFSSCTRDNEVAPDNESALDKTLTKLLDQNSEGQGTDFFKLPESSDFSKIPQDPNNPLTISKVELGKLLFHDAGLAVNPKFDLFKDTYSCATCHHQQAGFQAGRAQAISEGGVGFGQFGETREKDEQCPEDSLDIQQIRTPAALNTAYQRVMVWNGQFGAKGPNAGTENLWTPGTPLENNFLGYEGVETQAIAAMSVHRLGIPMDLIESTDYKSLFDEAFPDVPAEQRYTKTTAGLAMAAYERSVVASEAPFQRYLDGNTNALTDDQKKGAILFFGKANCVSCHTGPALNTNAFYAYGMKDLEGPNIYGPAPADNVRKGRGGFTGNDEDNYKFKVPQLYNLHQADFLGHGSSFTSVEQVVRYKNKGMKENNLVLDSQLAEEFVPLGLSEEEIQQLTAFLEFGLYDADLARYQPPSVPSGLCIPNNDEASRIDLGCVLP